jgi:hypothetical protein
VYFRFSIRIGDQHHDAKHDDENVLELEIKSRSIHPKYDNESAYFDIAIFETNKLSFSRVSFLQLSEGFFERIFEPTEN